MDTIQFAIAAAVHAPSVHNTQPWRFGHGERRIDVYADASRRLRVADPDGRETFAAVAARHTHRGGFGPGPLPAGTLSALQEEAAKEGAMLRLVADDDQRAALAAAVQAGEHALRLDGKRATEQAHWVVSPGSTRHDGIPPAAYPAEPAHTEPDFPGRDFAAGQGWGLAAPAAAGERFPGVVCLLATGANEPADWVVAGQALQRVLLRAAASRVASALHSQPLELPQLRDFIRVQLAVRAHPQMIIRLGVTSQAGSASIRRPVEDVLLGSVPTRRRNGG